MIGGSTMGIIWGISYQAQRLDAAEAKCGRRLALTGVEGVDAGAQILALIGAVVQYQSGNADRK